MRSEVGNPGEKPAACAWPVQREGTAPPSSQGPFHGQWSAHRWDCSPTSCWGSRQSDRQVDRAPPGPACWPRAPRAFPASPTLSSPHTGPVATSTLRSRVNRNHASPSCPVWKPRPASAVNYEARPGAGRFPEAQLWESALGNPLGRHLQAQRGRFCAPGALLLRSTWNLHAFTGFVAALGQGRRYSGLNILIQIKKKKNPHPQYPGNGPHFPFFVPNHSQRVPRTLGGRRHGGVPCRPLPSRGPPLPSPSHRPGQRAGWAVGSGGVRQGRVRRAGGGQGPVGFEQAIQAPLTGSKSASHVGDAFLFTLILTHLITVT